jgi:hypothetical protein
VPLDATRFQPTLQARSADIRQFVDLFTGVMTDQVVTFAGGSNLTQPVILSRDPQATMEAATKQYVDAHVSALSWPLLGPDGTAAAPSYSFTSQPGMGMFRQGNNVMGFSANGTQVLQVGAGGVATMGVGFSSAANVNVGTTLLVSGLGTFNSGVGVGVSPVANQLTVGPTFTLAAQGNATVAGTLGVTGATTLGGTLGVTGAATFATTVAATGNVSTSGTFLGNGAVPAGGAVGDVLTKNSATDFDLHWAPAAGGGGLGLPLTQDLTFSPNGTYNIGPAGFEPANISATGTVTAAQFTSPSATQMCLGSGGSIFWCISTAGNFIASTTDTYNIGTSWTVGRPNFVYAANVATGHAILANAGAIQALDSGGAVHNYLTFGGEQLHWDAMAGGFRWVNQGNTVQLMALTSGGTLSVTGDANVSGNVVCLTNIYAGPTSAPNNSVWASTFRFGASGGSYYLNTNGAVLQVVNMNVLSWGWVGFNGNSAINFSWDGVWQVASQSFRSAGNIQAAGYVLAVGRLISNNYDSGWSNSLGGNLIISGTSLMMAANGGIGFVWNGSYIQCQNNFQTLGILYANGSLVSMNWNVSMPNNFGGGGGSGGNVSCSAQRGYHSMRDWADQQGNSNCFVAPNIGDARGQALAQSWGTWSTRRHKRNVRAIPGALDLLRDDLLHGVLYDNVNARLAPDDILYTDEKDASIPLTTPSIGFVADDWLERVPELVGTDVEGNAEYMDYSRVGAVLWEAMKQYVQTTDARIADLERRLALAGVNGVVHTEHIEEIV